jgi:hypothetical protein
MQLSRSGTTGSALIPCDIRFHRWREKNACFSTAPSHLPHSFSADNWLKTSPRPNELAIMPNDNDSFAVLRNAVMHGIHDTVLHAITDLTELEENLFEVRSTFIKQTAHVLNHPKLWSQASNRGHDEFKAIALIIWAALMTIRTKRLARRPRYQNCAAGQDCLLAQCRLVALPQQVFAVSPTRVRILLVTFDVEARSFKSE